MSAKQLSDRCGQLGMDIPRAVLANLENGRRSTVTVAELLVLAQALEVPPLLLVVPLARQESVEILPGLNTPTWDAAKWLRGDGTQITVLGEGPRVTKDATRKGPLDRVMEHEDLVTHWEIASAKARNEAAMARRVPENERNGWLAAFNHHSDDAMRAEKRLAEVRQAMRAASLIPPPLPLGLEHADGGADTQPVVAVIVTSAKGVLVGRRNDGKPPWTFIAGEVEPGERLEDAATREVKEETGLDVRTGRLIGERDHHPSTGRHMIYLAAKPAGRSTKIAVGDEAELAEVRWVSLVEADQLLPGLYPPVREYLTQALAGGQR